MSSATGDDPKSTARTNPFTKSAGTRIPPLATEERLTRSRSRLMASEKTGPKEPAQSVGGKRPRVEGVNALAKERTSVGRSKKQKTKHKTAAAAGGTGRLLSAEEAALAARPLPPSEPPYPKSGKHEDWVTWMAALMNNQKLGDEDSVSNLPTLRREVKDIETVESVECLQDKDMVLDVARSVVGVLSTALDGRMILQCTGIVVGLVSDEAGKHVRILASSRTVCTKKGRLHDPEPKLFVRLPNNTLLKGQLLFFNDHYGIAILDVLADFPFELTRFGSTPEYGQEVFVLSRDEESSLLARRGTILCLEETFFGRNHNMFLSCEIPKCGTGGPVIGHDGIVTGMTFRHNPYPAIIAVSTILTCIEMWRYFGRIARPVPGMDLRSVVLLDMSLREKLSSQHNINNGFIVDRVSIGSTAERLGIRQGDVIVLLHEQCGSTLPQVQISNLYRSINLDIFMVYIDKLCEQLEDFLLSLGWGYLQRSISLCSTVDFQIEVHDLSGRVRRNIALPVAFSDASERVKN